MEDGVRVIDDLVLYEWGPVIFPANDKADIVAVRNSRAAMHTEDIAALADSLRQLNNTLKGA